MRHLGIALFVPMLALALSLAMSCAGCPSPPLGTIDAGPAPRPETYDGGDVCAHLCDHLAGIPCKEGFDDAWCKGNGPGTCHDVLARRLTDLHSDCLLDAGSKESARACQSVLCP